MNLEFPQYLENSQSNPLQKEKVVFCKAECEHSLSAQVSRSPILKCSCVLTTLVKRKLEQERKHT